MKNTSFIVVFLLACLQAAAGQDTTVQTAPPGAQRPHAQSQQEYNDYHIAWSAKSGAALEQAASNFTQKYPNSELRLSLFSKALRQYQSENDAAGILAMGEKVLALDPNDSLALVLSATVQADSLTAGDPDRSRKIAEISRDATRAIQTADSNFATSAPATARQAAIYKTTLQSMAYAAMGVMKLKTGDDAGAEKDLREAAELAKIRPDPYIWYHLALAQDHRKKYPAALNSVEQALQLASANPELQRLAEVEHDRLNRLAAGHTDDNSESGGTQPPL